jgi:hypothetical protein
LDIADAGIAAKLKITTLWRITATVQGKEPWQQ